MPRCRNWLLQKTRDMINSVSVKKIRKYILGLHFTYYILCTEVISMDPKQIYSQITEEHFDTLIFSTPKFWTCWLDWLENREILIILRRNFFESPAVTCIHLRLSHVYMAQPLINFILDQTITWNPQFLWQEGFLQYLLYYGD